MKKNLTNDNLDFITPDKIPASKPAPNSTHFITDNFLWPSQWANDELKERGEEWVSVSLCDSSPATDFSSASHAVRNREHLQTLRTKTPNNNPKHHRLDRGFNTVKKKKMEEAAKYVFSIRMSMLVTDYSCVKYQFFMGSWAARWRSG